MTHQGQSAALDDVLQLLAEHGFDGTAEAITVLMNETMKLERIETLLATPHERSAVRRG